MQIFIFLAEGFEELEAISIIDVLRRSELDVITVSITNKKLVLGAHNIPVVADKLFEETKFLKGEVFVLPGGMPGSSNLNVHVGLQTLLKRVNLQNKKIVAICAAPIILAKLNLLRGKKATIYPGFEDCLEGVNYIQNGIVKDTNIITATGPSFAVDLALFIITELQGKEKSEEVAKSMLWKQTV